MKNAIHILVLLLLVFANRIAFADSATWDSNPTTGDWNTATNWTPDVVPNGPADTATFASSSITSLSLSADTEVNGIVFGPGASPFTITTTALGDLSIDAGGVVNNSDVTQSFVINSGSALQWFEGATAGANTVFTLNGGSSSGSAFGYLIFFGGSSAGEATFISDAGLASGAPGSYMQIYRDSTAGNGNFVIHGGAVPGAGGGYVEFGTDDAPGSNAGNATFTVDGGSGDGAYGGTVSFYCYTSAASATFKINGAKAATAFPGSFYFTCDATLEDATLIAKGGQNGGPGGQIVATYGAIGGAARIILSGNATLDISGHDAPGMTIGSLEGQGGSVFLGSNTLSVGGNNRNTTFRGTLGDRGIAGGRKGALTKLGDGKLILAGPNRYTGDTHVQQGVLLVNNASGSGTGDGDVFVDKGVLGGTGNIAGAVAVGTGSARAALRPGEANDLLSVEKSLTLNSVGTCQIAFDSDLASAGGVAASGVTINGALFALSDEGTSTLPVGFTITAISNTSANPTSGTFANLADGGTIAIGSNTFQANYEGGDGNDLTLTVVP